jgi:hypothetical protein
VPYQSRPYPEVNPRAQNTGSYGTTPQYGTVDHGYTSASSLSQNYTRGQSQQTPKAQTQTNQSFGQNLPFSYKQRSSQSSTTQSQSQVPQASVVPQYGDPAYRLSHRGTQQRANREFGHYLNELNQLPPTSGGYLQGDQMNGILTLAVHPPTPNEEEVEHYRGEFVPAGVYVESGSRRLSSTETEPEEDGNRGRTNRYEHRRTQAVSAIGSEMISRLSSPGLAEDGGAIGDFGGLGRFGRGDGNGSGGRSKSAHQL